MDKRDSLKLGYSLVANTLPETDGYHAVVSHVGSVDKDTFCSRVAARCPGLEASTVELVLSSVCSTAAEFLAERQYRVALGDVTFELAVPGSTDSVDGDVEGPAYVAVRPSKSLRNAAAGVTPVYSGIEGDRTDIFTVEDFATRASNTIIGTDSFRVVGVNLSAVGDGESAKVTASDGSEAIAEVVDEDGAGRHITARLAESLRPGKGKVTLTTHGWRTPEGELRTLVKSVTILAGEEPTPPEPIAQTRDGLVKVMSLADDETGETFTYGDTWRAHGEGFVGTAPGWAVNMAFIQLAPDEEVIALDFDVMGAAEIKLDSKPEYPVAPGDYPGAKLMVEFCHPDAEDPDEQVSETLVIPIHIVAND